MSDVEKAEQTLAELERKRKALVESRAADADARRAVAFKAHAGGDKTARKKLDELADAAARFESELRSVDDAIAEAQAQLGAARAAAARERDREQALALRAVLAEFVELGVELDAALQDVAGAGHALREVVVKLRALNCTYPTDQMVFVLGLQAVKTALMSTPWAKEFPHLAPRERRSWAALVREWAQRIESNYIAPHLGAAEQTTDEAA